MIRFFNTLSGVVEEFVPLKSGEVGLYTCGPTVYDFAHIGNFRSYVFEDLLKRFLLASGYRLTHVMNITDVDDKTIRGAREQGLSLAEYTEPYVEAFFRDIRMLNILPADHYPRATEHIPDMVGLIRRLLEKGYAYEKDGSVYFSIAKFPAYGRLSGVDLSRLHPGQRGDTDEYEKENVHDFALWKKAKEGEPFWTTELGPGRPGWHIECSAMSMHYLGETFDIHGGGADLIFPHHENEIAQSEAVTGRPLARYWVHNGLITINQEKMSKSLGNFFTIREVLAKFHPEVVRLFLIQAHYRSPLDFSDQALEEAETALERLYRTIQRLDQVTPGQPPTLPPPAALRLPGLAPEEQERLYRLRERVLAAMDDDFNTALALGHLFEAVRLLNRVLESGVGEDLELQALAWIGQELRLLGGALNLLQDDPGEILRKLRQKTDALTISPREIEALITERQAARKRKDYKRADAIRQQLAQAGIILEDTPQGTTWRVKS